MIRYEKYFKTFGYRRIGDVRKIHSIKSFEELPMGSILHWMECLGNPISKETSPLPDPTIMETYVGGRKKLIYPELSHDMTDSVIQDVDTSNIRTIQSKTYKAVKKIRSGNCRLVKDPSGLYSNATIQSIILYDPLMSAAMTGRFHRVRMFNIVLAKMLTHVSKDPVSDHFIYLPIEYINLAPIDFVKSLKEYSRTAYTHEDSYYFLFMMHLYGYLQEEPTDSYFEKVSEQVLSKINIMLVNQDTDRMLHIRLDRLKLFSEKDPFIAKKLLNVANVVARELVPELQLGEISEELINVDESVSIGNTGEGNVTEFKEAPSKAEQVELVKETIVDRDNKSAERIANSDELSIVQKQAAAKNAAEYKKVRLGEHTLEEHILDVSQELPKAKNDVSDVVDVPDKSVTASTMYNFAQEYMDQSFDKDMAATLSSFGKQGMYVVDIKTEEISDDLNEATKYTVKFKDDRGVPHTIKYRMPRVDEDGNCLINGSIKRMSLQRINTPICKISPTRVSLSSSANKTIVERNSSFSNTLSKQIRKYLDKTSVEIAITLGSNSYTEITLPNDYTAMSKTYVKIVGGGMNLIFDYNNRLPKNAEAAKAIQATETKTKTVYIGKMGKDNCFMNIDNVIDMGGAKVRLLNIFDAALVDVTFTPYNEWVNILLLNKKFPVIFILAYRFGFENILNYLKADYSKIAKGSRLKSEITDIIIKTYDVTYVIKDPTTIQRLLISGMNYFNLKEVEHTALDETDAYFTMLQSKGMSIEYLRGIDFLFELFLDPITIDVLQQMQEPTNMRDLLIRSTVLLSTSDHKEVASSSNFRYRSYEQMNAILYKTLARALATYQNKSIGHTNKFSISEFEVFTNIVTDPLFNNVNIVNPIATVKEQLHYTHIGDGGRSGASMMIPDRRYPTDGPGIMSEATVDSGKVGIDGILSTNASIANTRGLPAVKNIKDVSNSELLSPTALIYPGATMDDAKRVNFISIQMSQFIPVEKTNMARVRTGYERVIAHRAGMPFAYVAKEKGKVTALDDSLKLITIEYTGGEKVTIEYGEVYSRHSSENFHITQQLVVNGLVEKNRFSKGDVIVYNESYFSNDPLSSQVDMGLGYFATVAFMESAKTLEDANYISSKLNEALRIKPVQTRAIQLSKSTVLHKVATIGMDVKSIDPIMIFDEIDIGDTYDDDEDTAAIIAALNKSIPKAKYSGKIVDIEVFYKCEISEMTESMAKFVRAATKTKNAKANFSKASSNASTYKASKPLTSDKIDGIMLDDEIVYIKYYIQQDLDMSSSDKIVFGAQLKSICSGVTKEAPTTESGREIDAIMSASSVFNRMTPSIMFQGSLETIMEKVEEDVVAAYFN